MVWLRRSLGHKFGPHTTAVKPCENVLPRPFGLLIGLAVAMAARPGVGKPLDPDMTAIWVEKGTPRARERHGGDKLRLTVDPQFQKRVELILAGSRAPSGAVVVSDVRNGRILAWATVGNEGDLVRDAKYPSASLFKVVTAAALLESGRVRASDTVCFGGGDSGLKEADIVPGCHAGDHKIRFGQALGKSINSVFARLALDHLSPDQIRQTAGALGLFAPPPIDLPADKSFIQVPDEDFGFAKSAAGFGRGKVSALSALFMMQTIANRGRRIGLHVTGPAADVPRVELGSAMSERVADSLVRMLEFTTTGGTSKHAFRVLDGKPRIRVAGKTGTLLTEHPRRLVSWFAGFAPVGKPEIVVTVLLANRESWWRKGNEVARDVFDAYFAKGN